MGSGITRCTPPVERRSDDAGCGDHGTVTGQRFWRARRPIYCSAVQGGTPHATRPKRTDLIPRDALASTTSLKTWRRRGLWVLQHGYQDPQGTTCSGSGHGLGVRPLAAAKVARLVHLLGPASCLPLTSSEVG